MNPLFAQTSKQCSLCARFTMVSRPPKSALPVGAAANSANLPRCITRAIDPWTPYLHSYSRKTYNTCLTICFRNDVRVESNQEHTYDRNEFREECNDHLWEFNAREGLTAQDTRVHWPWWRYLSSCTEIQNCELQAHIVIDYCRLFRMLEFIIPSYSFPILLS